MRLARLSSIAGFVRRVLLSTQAEVSLHRAVLQLLGHPGLDVLVELASVHLALLALLLADNFPSRLQRVRADAASVQGNLGAVNCSVNNVEVW